MSVSETTNQVEKEAERPPLLPERHPNHDLFVCDVLDAIPKDDLASMEHPVFSLATKPDTRTLNYEHRNIKIQITPSVKGLATIFDKDLLIYCVSQVMAKKNQGKPISQNVQLQAHDLLVWTNRETSGDGYRRMVEAFERLGGTRITTNIKAGGTEITNGFGLIDSFRVVRETPTGRMSEVQVRLSDWMFKIIEGSEVLTLSRDYFRLRKPIERRIYEIARKHCGEQDSWRISLDLLQKKTGASSHGRAFKAMVRELIEHDHLPDYGGVLQPRGTGRAGARGRLPDPQSGNLQRRPDRGAWLRRVLPGAGMAQLLGGQRHAGTAQPRQGLRRLLQVTREAQAFAVALPRRA
jgi:plasmid replication initiation protein